MMRTMRAKAKWIMGVVAFFFVGWMIYGYGMDITGRGSSLPNSVVKVNGQTIDATTFYAAVQNEQERLRAAGGAVPETLEDRQALEDQVLEQMIQNIILEQEFRRRGIRVTDQEVIEAAQTSPPPEVFSMPQFQTDGQFDLQKYQRFVSSGADPTFLLALEARYRDELPRIKFFDQITAGMYVSDAALWRQFRDRDDSVTAVVLALFPQIAVADSTVAVTDDEVAAHYRAHRDDFSRPATVYLTFVTLSRAANAADSAAALERAQRIYQTVREGADFAETAQRESSDSVSAANGGDLGEGRVGRFIPAFEDAALALRPGAVSEPVPSQFGYHIIKLESRTDTTYHARHILIPIELAGEHLDYVESRADTLDLYAAEQDDPSALDQVAQWLSLPVAQAAPLTEGGRLQLGRDVIGDAGVWAFGGDVGPGQTSPVIETDNAYYVFRLDSLVPEGVPPLEQVRERVRAAAMRQAKITRTAEMAREIAAAVSGGATLEAVAERLGLSTRTVGPFTRYTPAPVFQNAPEAAGAAFAMGVGETGGPIVTDVGTYFVRTIRKVVADSAQFVAQLDTLRTQALQQARQQRVQLTLASLRQAANVQDLRREMERAQRQAADAALPNSQAY